MKTAMIMIMVHCVFAVIAQAAEFPSMRLHWSFDVETGRGEIDGSGNGHHALLLSGANPRQHPPTSREPGRGILGGGAEIHSRSLIKTIEPVPFGDRWTLSLWLRQSGFNAADDLVRIEGLTVDAPAGGKELVIDVEGIVPFTATRTRAGEWEHLAVVVAPGRVKVFLDGKLVRERTQDAWTFPHVQSQIQLGAPNWHALYGGFFDEVRLYNGALDDEAVAQLADPAAYASMNYPARVSAGPAAMTWLPAKEIELKGRIDDDGNAPVSFAWTVLSKPDGAEVMIDDPTALQSKATLSVPGDYRFTLTVTDGPYTLRDTVNAVVFPEEKIRPPGTPYAGPHASPTNGYDAAFVAKYFPPLGEIPLHREGFVADRFSPPPPPYVHPRIFFNRDELPELRARLLSTRAGQLRMRRLRDTLGHLPWIAGPYELPPDMRNLVVLPTDEEPVYDGPMPDLDHDVELMTQPVTGVELSLDEPETGEGGATAEGEILDFYRPMSTYEKGQWKSDLGQEASMLNEAFRCLVDADSTGARKVIDVLVTSAEAKNRYLATDAMKAAWNWQTAAQDVAGRYGTALIYDFLYPWMTEAERDTVRRALAAATAGRWAIGMRGVNAGTVATGNWTSWLMGDLTINLLAIEGEDGFDAVNYRDGVEAWRKFMTYSFFADSGAPFEAIGKGLMSAEKLAPLTKRGEPLLAAQSAYRYVAGFMLHTMLPQGGLFIRDDLHGGIGKPILADICAIKYAYPGDPVIDFVYRNAMEDTYPGGVAGTTYSAAIAPAPVWQAEDWSGPADWDAHLAQTLKAAGGLPLSWFAEDTGVMVVRDRWSRDALHLYFRPRRLGGHKAPNRGTIVVSALGRTWNYHSSMGERAGSQGYSVVVIDGKTSSSDDARVLHYRDTPLATFAAADLTRCYSQGGRMDVTWNDSRMTPLKAPWADLPKYKMPNWYDGTRPAVPEEEWDTHAAVAAKAVGQTPVAYAYRTAGIVRGKHPYLLVVDDLSVDGAPHRYDWMFRLDHDVRVQAIKPDYFRKVDMPGHGEYWLPRRPEGGDILLAPEEAGPEPAKGTPMLLIRVLERNDDHFLQPLAYLLNDDSTMHRASEYPSLVIPSQSVRPDFKVMIYPFRFGVDPLPTTTWGDEGTLNVRISDQADVFRFTRGEEGLTLFDLQRISDPGAGDAARFQIGKDEVDEIMNAIESGDDFNL